MMRIVKRKIVTKIVIMKAKPIQNRKLIREPSLWIMINEFIVFVISNNF